MFRPLQRQLCEAMKYNGRPHPERGRGGRRARPFLRPAVFSFRNRKTVRARGPNALRSLYRRVFAGTFPEPERAVAGSPGTRGRPNFQKKESVGGFIYPPTLPESGSRDPAFRILSLGTGCLDDFFGGRMLPYRCFGAPHSPSCLPAFFRKKRFDCLCRMGFAQGAMIAALQRVFRKRMPRHRRYRLPVPCFSETGDVFFSQEAFRLSVPE